MGGLVNYYQSSLNSNNLPCVCKLTNLVSSHHVRDEQLADGDVAALATLVINTLRRGVLQQPRATRRASCKSLSWARWWHMVFGGGLPALPARCVGDACVKHGDCSLKVVRRLGGDKKKLDQGGKLSWNASSKLIGKRVSKLS